MSRRHLASAIATAAALVLAGLPAAAQADALPLVGWWPMNEGTGQVVRDWSLHGNDGQLGSTPGPDANDPSWIPGVFVGSALRFDGVDDYVRIPDSQSLEPASLTVAAWVRGSGSPGAFRYIVAKGAVTCDHSSYGLYSSADGGVGFYVADTAQYHRSPEAPPTIWDGNWHNVAGTFDGTTVRLYVDGRQVGAGTPAATTIDYNLPVQGGTIGSYGGDCNPALTLRGDVDGVQIWSRALPVDAIWRTLKALFTQAR
jgi:hypothetical protein